MSYSSEPFTWTDLWAECTERLGNSDEARLIIEQASGRAGASWLITMTMQAPESAAERVGDMLKRRLAGEPMQYVLGRWGFRQLSLRVDRRVLIPRPETEHVAGQALQEIKEISSPVVADLGTGTGAIAFSIAVEDDDALVYATDASADALEVAEANLADLPDQAQERVQLLQGSWFDALPPEARGRLDLIVSNPPYIGESERETLDRAVLDWEPHSALFADDDGIAAIEHILRSAPEWLSPRGSVVIELAPHQASRAEALAWELGFFSVSIGRDLSQRERWVTARRA